MTEISRIIGIYDMARAGSKTRKRVGERIKAGQCLVCDKLHLRRGLCGHCYHLYRMALLRAGSPVRQARFEATQIKLGHVLPVRQVSRIKANNPFEKVG